MRRENWIDLGFLLGLILVVYGSLLIRGLPQTHDGQLHVARLAQYYLAVNQDQLPPRLAPNANYGFGYPVFNFNYPLPYLLGTGLIKAQLPIETAMKVLTLSAMVLAGWGMYLWLSDKVSRLASGLGALLYAASNYALLLVFVRGGIGEIWAYALMPWVFWFMKKFNTAGSREAGWWRWAAGAGYGLFLLAHNIMAVFGTIILGGWLGYHVLTKRFQLRKIWQPLVIGAGLAAWFWLPALGEQKYSIIGDTPLNNFYQDHFPTLRQLIFDAWGSGYSRPGPVDGLSFNVNWVWLLILGWGGILIFIKKVPGWVKWLYGLMAVWLFIILPVSKAVWGILPVVNYIQFPWRLLFFWPLMAVPVIAWIFDSTRANRGVWLVLGFVLSWGVVTKNQNFETFSHSLEYWWHFDGTTSLLDENMPIWFNKNINYALSSTLFEKQPVVCVAGECEVNISEWTGTKRVYRVAAATPQVVVERITYFPGTEVRLNGQPTLINYTMAQYPGLITFEIPAGEVEVISEFTQNTRPRLIGNLTSVMTGVILLVGLGYGLNQIRKRQ